MGTSKRVRGFARKVMAAVLVMAFAVAMPLTAFANDGISVVIDGVRVAFDDQQPVIVDGRTLVPVRGVFETLGFEVEWEAPSVQQY